jgi:hypothetical protein
MADLLGQARTRGQELHDSRVDRVYFFAQAFELVSH